MQKEQMLISPVPDQRQDRALGLGPRAPHCWLPTHCSWLSLGEDHHDIVKCLSSDNSCKHSNPRQQHRTWDACGVHPGSFGKAGGGDGGVCVLCKNTPIHPPRSVITFSLSVAGTNYLCTTIVQMHRERDRERETERERERERWGETELERARHDWEMVNRMTFIVVMAEFLHVR